ncbi:hypothetical protein J3A78_007664 [Streptomyces sp. PvR006]|uniref:hypothetical protein n=1 Tax=Streptomyces sp. PvR006 TaxID=2817860 RepID=UPI001AE900D8|nr:hypothetical protein [Streptomyces sp. PvR006]MBP2579531.1 hypothetical protein [Streptomyces sp. PvR006]MBP2587186.1 hypothetical protein [Streptomyces sp. PvR006]
MPTPYLGIDHMDAAQAHDTSVQALTQPHIHPHRKHTLANCTPDNHTYIGTMGLLVEDHRSNAMPTTLVLLTGAAVSGQGTRQDVC